MKRLLLFLLVLFALIANAACAGNDKVIQMSQLPEQAQQFVATHFSTSKVMLVKSDLDGLTKDYEVMFEDGNSVDFNSKGAWTDVDCKASAVPEAIVPAQILSYIKKNYPDCKVLEIDRDRAGYEVKLSNQMELDFDKRFRLIDIDR